MRTKPAAEKGNRGQHDVVLIPHEGRRRAMWLRQSLMRRGHKARRWVVERSHSWMNRFRRILVRWEKRADTYVAMLHLACAIITWKACGLLQR